MAGERKDAIGVKGQIFGKDENGDFRTFSSSPSGRIYTDTYVQDQTTRPVIAKFHLVENETTLAVATAIDDRTITVADPTGFVAGKYVKIFDVGINRFFLCYVISVLDSVVTLDSPLDFAFPIGSHVTVGTSNINANGSVTPVVYGLRNTTDPIGTTFDVTRVILTMICDSPVDLSLFGNLTALTNGLVLRKVDGDYQVLSNVKSNFEFAGIMYDFDIFDATNPAQGVDGLKGRMTFAGQNKMGVAIRLAPGEDLQVVVQDDLSELVDFEIVAEGHVVSFD